MYGVITYIKVLPVLHSPYFGFFCISIVFTPCLFALGAPEKARLTLIGGTKLAHPPFCQIMPTFRTFLICCRQNTNVILFKDCYTACTAGTRRYICIRIRTLQFLESTSSALHHTILWHHHTLTFRTKLHL